MGRYSTGAITTGEAQRLELSFLLKQGMILPEGTYSGSLGWNNGSNISIYSEIREGRGFIRLLYWNKSFSGEVNNLDYKIQLHSIPSNLGKGKIWYFICPITGRKARILYKCYGSLYFISRLAYNHRIYYPSQISSKNNLHNEKYFYIEGKLEKLQPMIRKKHYQGKETRILKRISILESKKEFHDLMRWKMLPKNIQKAIRRGF